MDKFKAFRLFMDDGNSSPKGRFTTMGQDDLPGGDVLIRVSYSSINYKDALASAGVNKIIRQFPKVGGIDLTGRVFQSSDSRFSAGDPVIVHGFGIGVDRDGGHAEFARVPADFVLRLPDNLSLLEAASIGVAGYTAALSIYWMEHNGLKSEPGRVLVSGATGGVASLSIDILSKLGYAITAMSGKAEEKDYLRSLGAGEIISPDEAKNTGRPIESARWAGAIDSVGGEVLGWILRTTEPDGVVASVGNAGGSTFNGSVLPFILRGARLIGINGNSPMPLRRMLWDKIADRYRPRHLTEITQVVEFDHLPEAMERMLQRRSRGRTVVRLAED